MNTVCLAISLNISVLKFLLGSSGYPTQWRKSSGEGTKTWTKETV